MKGREERRVPLSLGRREGGGGGGRKYHVRQMVRSRVDRDCRQRDYQLRE